MLFLQGFFGEGNLSSSGLRYQTTLEARNKMESNATGDLQNLRQHTFRKSNSSNSEVKDSDQASAFKNLQNASPDKMKEVLHLCLEEAFFLSYTLGTLVLTNEDGCEMDIDDMWSSFLKIDSRFCIQYAVYHHFRCKGWVVKPGIKFGADWGKFNNNFCVFLCACVFIFLFLHLL